MTETEDERAIVTWRNFPNLKSPFDDVVSPRKPLWNDAVFSFAAGGSGVRCEFACLSTAQTKPNKELAPTADQLLKHPLAVVALVPRDAALFLAGAVAGAAAKTVTAPLDRIKLLMQVRFHFVNSSPFEWKFGTEVLCVFDVLETTLRFRRLTGCELGKKVPRRQLV